MSWNIGLKDNIGTLSHSAGIISLLPSLITIGGRQYKTTASITLNPAIVGAGGVDVTAQNWKLYHVYAVVSAGAPALVGSTSSTGPAGFSSSTLIGYFDTNNAAQLIQAAKTLTGTIGDYKSAHMSEEQFQSANGPGWVLADGRNVVGSAWATLHAATTVPDSRGVVLRGKNNGRADGFENPDGDSSLGAFQNDAMQGHNHQLRAYTGGGAGINMGSGSSNSNNALVGFYSGSPSTDGTNGTPRAASESRMRNVTANHFLKIN